METQNIISIIGEWVDVAGVGLIIVGLLGATARFLLRFRQQHANAYQGYREDLGKTLLLGLEFLVAADIIRTVAVDPTFSGLGILALIVVIRTFLSWSLEVELEGRWPWQHRQHKAEAAEASE